MNEYKFTNICLVEEGNNYEKINTNNSVVVLSVGVVEASGITETEEATRASIEFVTNNKSNFLSSTHQNWRFT